MAAEAEGVHERKSNLAIPWRTANNVERANEWIRVGEIERGVHAAISHCTDRCRSAERARGGAASFREAWPRIAPLFAPPLSARARARALCVTNGDREIFGLAASGRVAVE